MKNRARAGFSLLEFLIILSLIGSVAGVTLMMSRTSGSLTNQSQVTASLDQQLHRTLDRIGKKLRYASLSSLLPASAAGSPTLTFQVPVDYSGGSVVLGPAQVIRWESAPGDTVDDLDNNGNGLVDEGRVVWLEDVSEPSRTISLSSSTAWGFDGETPNGVDDNGNGLIDEPGLSFELNGRTLTIRMTVQGVDDSGVIHSRSRKARVSLRNP